MEVAHGGKEPGGHAAIALCDEEEDAMALLLRVRVVVWCGLERATRKFIAS